MDQFIGKTKVISFLNQLKLTDIVKETNSHKIHNIWVLKNREDNMDVEDFYLV